VEYLQACARRASAMNALGPPEGLETQVRKLMDLHEESPEDYIAARCGDDQLDCNLLRAVAEANRRWGKQTGLEHADTIEAWLALTPIERAAALSDILKVVKRVYPGPAKADPAYESGGAHRATLIGQLLPL